MIDKESGEVLLPPIRTRYNYDTDSASLRSGLACLDKGRTHQSFKEQSDINTIVRQFGLTGELPQNVKVPQSGDYTMVVNDYQSAMNIVRQAEESFMQLPAETRKRFNNDPQQLQQFVENKDNLAEARKLGLAVPEVVPPPPPPPQPVRIVPDDTPPKGGATSST